MPSYLKPQWIILNILFCLTLTFSFSFLVIKNFSHPLAGDGDIDLWEYIGFYVFKNLSFLPFTHINLVNNQVFYPYGTNGVFQAWSFERDILYAVVYSLFGIGAWLQFYYLISVLITGIGTFILLVRDYGFARANGAAIIVSFTNFYAINKYPGHLNCAVVHWTVLNLIADFLLVKRLVLKQHISLIFILVRVLLLILAIGQDLGYIAGFALMSFTISTFFCLLLLVYRYLQKEFKFTELFLFKVKNYLSDLFAYPRICFSLIAFIFFFCYIYIPLGFEISHEAKSFDFTGVINGAYFTHPLRLLIPFLPSVNPGEITFEKIFMDSPEAIGAGSPGWFLLILGTVGLWQVRKKIIIFIPLLIIFLLCLFYHPTNFPTLRIFPWFAFNRVGGRSTVIYPVILCLFALHINLDGLRSRSKQLLSALLTLLACTEIYTAYSFKFSYQPYLLDKDFFAYMNYVKQQPGEAVLDWPFCVTGGNGVGSQEGFCPYYWKNSSIFALRRFHEKKVMGQYFGRLHPSQLEPYLQAGWNRLFSPNSPDILKATQQTQCFRADEWSFFTDFYKFNDFAGINLYTDLLPKSCTQEFYARFGNPTVETTVPGAGKVKFIPKSAELRSQVNLALGTEIKFGPFLDFSESNLLSVSSPKSFQSVTGFSDIEGNTPSNWRWALGPETNIVFKLNDSQSLALSFKFENPIEGQNVIVEVNGVTVESFNNLSKSARVDRQLRFQALKGINRIVFKYKYWNTNQVTFAPNDPRAMSVSFTRLLIKPARETVS